MYRQVYDTAVHQQIAFLKRPPKRCKPASASTDNGAPAHVVASPCLLPDFQHDLKQPQGLHLCRPGYLACQTTQHQVGPRCSTAILFCLFLRSSNTYGCQLFWEGDCLLYVGWGNSIQASAFGTVSVVPRNW
jgi:hypothetical protein